MKLRANSRLVRWAYSMFAFRLYDAYICRADGRREWLGFTKIPPHTTLCRFFWRAFVFVPLFWGVIVSACGAVLWFLVEMADWQRVLTTAAQLTLLIIGIVAVIYLIKRYNRQISVVLNPLSDKVECIQDTVTQSVFWQGVKTLRGKLCPLITIERT